MHLLTKIILFEFKVGASYSSFVSQSSSLSCCSLKPGQLLLQQTIKALLVLRAGVLTVVFPLKEVQVV